MEVSKLSSLSNPLATTDQLTHSASQLDGVPLELERTLRYHGCLLTQAACILLRLNQDVIAQAIVTFSRFFVGSEGGSFRENGVKVSLKIYDRTRIL
jgi:cyclin L